MFDKYLTTPFGKYYTITAEKKQAQSKQEAGFFGSVLRSAETPCKSGEQPL